MPPSEAPHPTNYHSYPPQSADHIDHMGSSHDAQPAATITVFNEQPDLLPQSAKAAQELLQEIQHQLQKLNQQDQKMEPIKVGSFRSVFEISRRNLPNCSILALRLSK
jgi:hypothetical protein